MLRFAQLLSGLFVLVLGTSALTLIFAPDAVNLAAGFNANTDYGFTNMRTLGAPLLSIALITAIGALKKDWILLLPASLYFLFNGSARVVSLFNEQYDPVMLRGLLLTFGLFALSQLALQIFRRATKKIQTKDATMAQA
ncbi:hypothetical protein [Kordiimonas laminariae]|uniref:hypothetical protein n=1 Tax=Kordiimonas laminariae TaxID=2917717 RepID=UPI001FF44122|nr:hypothetical protein [Kordiimonas laminariae]MCK0068171.1 hypothetical protein [Kordiimonas laminariae]